MLKKISIENYLQNKIKNMLHIYIYIRILNKI